MTMSSEKLECNVTMFVKDNQGNPLKFTKPLLSQVVRVMIDFPNNVWLVADCIEQGNIFVTHDFNMAVQYIKLCEQSGKSEIVDIQGYPSYESAYAVALDMRECSPYCYDEDEDITDLISELN
jgi:hypothetical protein